MANSELGNEAWFSRFVDRRSPASPQRLDAGLGDLLVLVRLHAGHADRADAVVLVHDRQAALDQDAGGKADEGRTFLDARFEKFARPLGERGGGRLAERHFGRDRRRAMELHNRRIAAASAGPWRSPMPA